MSKYPKRKHLFKRLMAEKRIGYCFKSKIHTRFQREKGTNAYKKCRPIKFNIRRNISTTNMSIGECVQCVCHTLSSLRISEFQRKVHWHKLSNYRHVILPNELARLVPKSHLMTETEWRNLGVQQSPGWIHYMLHAPEPQVLLFRRPLPQQQLPQPSTTKPSEPQLARTLNKYRLQKRCWTVLCDGRRTDKLRKLQCELSTLYTLLNEKRETNMNKWCMS